MNLSGMMKCFIFIISAICGIMVMCFQENPEDTEDIVRQLDRFDYEYNAMWWLHQTADWSYSTNVTSDSIKNREYVAQIFSEWMRKWKLWARRIDHKGFPTPVKDALDIIASGVIIMDAEDARLLSGLRSKITKIYSSANVSLPELNTRAQGEGEYGSLMGKIRDPDTLKKLWRSWRIQVGEEIHPLLLKLLKLTNKAAQENGFENIGSSWRNELGSDDILVTALSLWEEVKVLYAHLHAYTLHKLKLAYGEKYFKDSTFIPAHLLGSLWGENWVALNDILMPFPKQPTLNLTDIFLSKNYSVHNLIEKAEEFYVTAGLNSMKPSFWENSMFTKPKDGRLVDCHAASYDFALNCDYRIRMCGETKEQTFLEAIHEMGHIQYYMAYHKLPMIYRNGANSAFHEAVGETMVYAAQSPKCLELMKIVKLTETSSEVFLNNLMKQALSKFVLLPWALTIETWRYSLLEGKIAEEDMNEQWWKLRKSFQGVEPPDEENAKLFDAGTKYHVVNNIPYMRYFIGRFLEHQFLESLCDIAGESIHSCCFIKDKRAGKRLKKMLQLGSSVSWPDALETLTGKRELSAGPLIKYYQPLYLWLKDYNRNHNITILL